MVGGHGTRINIRGRKLDSFDFSYIDSLPTKRIGFARMTLSPVAETAAKPAIVFVHGNMQGAWIYSNWLKVIHDAGIAATAVDVRGHGGLPTEDLLSAGLSDYGDDVAGVARTFERPPVLAGHSMGGVMIGVAATRTPVAGLVLLTPSPPANLPGAQAVPPVDETRPLAPADEKTVREKYLPNHTGYDISAMLERQCPESSVAANDRYKLRVAVDVDKIDCPALCIAAGRDWPITHPPGQDAAVGEFYGAENVHLEEAAHGLMLDVDWRPGIDCILAWYHRVYVEKG